MSTGENDKTYVVGPCKNGLVQSQILWKPDAFSFVSLFLWKSGTFGFVRFYLSQFWFVRLLDIK